MRVDVEQPINVVLVHLIECIYSFRFHFIDNIWYTHTQMQHTLNNSMVFDYESQSYK